MKRAKHRQSSLQHDRLTVNLDNQRVSVSFAVKSDAARSGCPDGRITGLSGCADESDRAAANSPAISSAALLVTDSTRTRHGQTI